VYDPVVATGEAATGPGEGSAPQPAVETGRRPPATPAAYALVAANVAVFALEIAWGGSEYGPTLHRMGAGLGRIGLVHEPWRIVSSAFLHFGVLHLALNMWALLVFGRLLEVVLGARRFVVLYALCAAAGGLASSLVHAQILSAGASGAVWGLMTGQIALVVRLGRQQGFDSLPVRVSTLMQPLVVNLLFSLSPGIDMAAHLGGGAAGAALVLSGLVGWKRPEPAGWRWAAWGASVAMAACLVVALGHGRPWELRWPPSLVPRAIRDTPVTLRVPGGLQPMPAGDKNGTVFGEMSSDPLAVFFAAGRLEVPVGEQRRLDELSQAARGEAARALNQGESWDQLPHVVQLRVRPAVFSASRFRTGVRMQTWLMVEGSWWLRLDVRLSPDAPASWSDVPAAIANGITIQP
jgi:rhomboid protease GluP